MDWIQQWQSKLNKQNGVAPLVRTGGSRHTGLAALPYRNIHYHYPAFDTTQRWAKVPSQELSDALVEAFKDHLKDK